MGAQRAIGDQAHFGALDRFPGQKAGARSPPRPRHTDFWLGPSDYGTAQTPGSLTVLHNGVLVQDHVPVRGHNCVGEGPLVLQDHSRYVGRKTAIAPGVDGPAPDTTTRFRNIWMKRLGQ